MSIFHGIEETIKTKVGDGSVYIKRVKFCCVHGHIDLFLCGGIDGWNTAHDRCSGIENSHAAGLKAPAERAA